MCFTIDVGQILKFLQNSWNKLHSLHEKMIKYWTDNLLSIKRTHAHKYTFLCKIQ